MSFLGKGVQAGIIPGMNLKAKSRTKEKVVTNTREKATAKTRITASVTSKPKG